MIRTALAVLAIAMMPAIASAQSTDYSWLNDTVKPYEAKTTPADPNAPPPPAETLTGSSRTSFAASPSNTKSLLDGCVITAVGRLLQVDGLRVLNTSTAMRSSSRHYDFYDVVITVDLKGRQRTYQWICRVFENTSAALIANR